MCLHSPDPILNPIQYHNITAVFSLHSNIRCVYHMLTGATLVWICARRFWCCCYFPCFCFVFLFLFWWCTNIWWHPFYVTAGHIQCVYQMTSLVTWREPVHDFVSYMYQDIICSLHFIAFQLKCSCNLNVLLSFVCVWFIYQNVKNSPEIVYEDTRYCTL